VSGRPGSEAAALSRDGGGEKPNGETLSKIVFSRPEEHHAVISTWLEDNCLIRPLGVLGRSHMVQRSLGTDLECGSDPTVAGLRWLVGVLSVGPAGQAP
jgi:hypothetical protein